MSQNWKIEYYKTPLGAEPIYNFIESLPLKPKTKAYNTLELLTEFGIHLGFPHVKKVSGTPLWELRILGADNIRIFYIAISERTFLLLHGFMKKSQKTPTKDLNIALKRLREYKTRD